MTSKKHYQRSLIRILMVLFIVPNLAHAQGFEGYYRYPDIHADKIVFTAEGDLWTVNLSGGLAQRLTTHTEDESFPTISPDGKTIAVSVTDGMYFMDLNGENIRKVSSISYHNILESHYHDPSENVLIEENLESHCKALHFTFNI